MIGVRSVGSHLVRDDIVENDQQRVVVILLAGSDRAYVVAAGAQSTVSPRQRRGTVGATIVVEVVVDTAAGGLPVYRPQCQGDSSL